MVALYLAASAAQRYCVETGESGPLEMERLSALVAATTELRHAVMHWDDKLRTLPDTFISVNANEILALTRERKSRKEVVSGLSWEIFGQSADRLDKWATHKLDNP